MTAVAQEKPSWRLVREKGYCAECLWYTRWINQYLALPVTFLSWRLGLKPNAISLLSIMLTLAGAGVLLVPEPTVGAVLAAYVLLAAGYVLDSADGQLAKVASLASDTGKWLDHFLDGMKLILINSVFAWVAIRTYSHDVTRLAMIGTAFLLNMYAQCGFFLAWNFKVLIFGKHLIMRSARNKEQAEGLYLFMQPTDFGVFLFLTLFLCRPSLFVYLYFVYGMYFAAVTSGYVLLSVRAMLEQDATKCNNTPAERS